MSGARRAGTAGAAGLAALALTSVLAGGCVSYSGSSLPAKVRSWATSTSLVANNDTLVDDVARARLALIRGTAIELRTVCSGFEADIGTAYGTLPSPSPVLTYTFNQADEAFFKAAALCANAASLKGAGVRRALGDMEAGERELRRAAGELAGFGFHWVPHR
ncbi:MAG: hypothetical protein M0Z69_10500 [Actinomycetota bacterium]|nr:hypothetical protein [Actinomycetota bacterium]